jgi:cellobiose phosphorylase
LVVDPRLPPAWDGLGLRVRFHGSRVRVRIGSGELHLESDRPVPVHVDGIDAVVDGGGLRFGRTGESWELLT